MQICPSSHDTVITFEINRFVFLLTCTVCSPPHKEQEIGPFSQVGCAEQVKHSCFSLCCLQLLLHGRSQTLQQQQTHIIC